MYVYAQIKYILYVLFEELCGAASIEESSCEYNL